MPKVTDLKPNDLFKFIGQRKFRTCHHIWEVPSDFPSDLVGKIVIQQINPCGNITVDKETEVIINKMNSIILIIGNKPCTGKTTKAKEITQNKKTIFLQARKVSILQSMKKSIPKDTEYIIIDDIEGIDYFEHIFRTIQPYTKYQFILTGILKLDEIHQSYKERCKIIEMNESLRENIQITA